ncbi:MAG TPA: HD domain-containing phosphohydrolase [Clostridia bacterium]|nr:HD domain-containing phosphohydrolase [Clostridia bacterium]
MNFFGNILLLSNDLELYAKISKLLNRYEVFQQKLDLTNQMLHIYKYNPIAVIVDLDDYEYPIYKSMTMSDTDNYMPILALYSKEPDITYAIDEASEYYMHKSQISANLTNIIKIFSDFKKKYASIKQCYSINDMINSQTDNLLKRFTGNELQYFDSIELLLKHVFLKDIQLVNKPQYILIARRSDEDTEIDVYDLGHGDILKNKEFIELVDSNRLFGARREIENAFYTNLDKEEYSNLESGESIFDDELKARLGKIVNFAGYITTDTAILGINYKAAVSQFDSGIIKELCINYNLIQNIYRQMNKVNSAFIYTVNALSRASEVNDDSTGMHIKRVNAYSRLIAESLGLDMKYKDTIGFSAQMHDVGKLSIPKDILTKPDILTMDEFDIMKSHTLLGAKIIGDSPQLVMASEIAISHHEKFNGAGYPYGKAGEEIPLSGRIVAMADIYDALRAERVYKPAYGHKIAFDIITKGDGRVMPQHFDPQILDIFKRRHMDFCDIYEDIE